MDISTIIGLFLGVALVIGAIVTGDSPVIFLNVPSLMIVVGGTLGVTLIKNELRAVFGMLGVIKKAFLAKLPTPESLIAEMVTLAKTARKESLLALEKVPIHDNFMKFGLGMAVDGTEPKDIRAVLETEVAYQVARHRAGQNILEGIGASAPAFGMIGTLIGLVQMLANMSDPSNIGPAMAVALLTTFYGALLANIIFIPLAGKLRLRSSEEVQVREIMTEGILSISNGVNPRIVEQRLHAFLPPKYRTEAA